MATNEQTYYVYMLWCAGDTLYTGVTNDVERRFAVHKSGKGAKYTRAHPPIEVVYREKHKGRGRAQTREAQIKKMSHAEKCCLANIRI